MGTVPGSLRRAIAAELGALVRGERPELLTWAREYGDHGATLVTQPDEIWAHRWTDATPRLDGGWHVVVPLWTSEHAPSDLSAEVVVSPDGVARIIDVHVL